MCKELIKILVIGDQELAIRFRKIGYQSYFYPSITKEFIRATEYDLAVFCAADHIDPELIRYTKRWVKTVMISPDATAEYIIKERLFDSSVEHIFEAAITHDYKSNFLSYHIKQDHETLLDVSCGKGVYLRYWKWKGLSVVGTEETEDLVVYNKKMGLDCIQVNLNENPLKLPFPEKSIDVVTCTEVLEHIKHPKIVVSELARIARKLIMITTPVGHSYDSPDHINHWNSYSELEKDIIPNDITTYSVHDIVTKPEDWPMKQRSFIVVINL